MIYNPIKDTWLNPNIEFLIDYNIIEYDIIDAGISIIQEFNLLDKNQIEYLKSLDKFPRHVAIGKIQGANKEFSQLLIEKFSYVRELFITSNNITNNDIISVKKDAMYITKNCNNTKFGKIEFIPKNIYSTYIRFSENYNIEIYYNSTNVDIKGMGELSINKHRLYLYNFIKNYISKLESKDKSVKRFLISFINEYKNMNLDNEYYIEFNNMSKDFNPIYNFKKVLIPLTKILLREM